MYAFGRTGPHEIESAHGFKQLKEWITNGFEYMCRLSNVCNFFGRHYGEEKKNAKTAKRIALLTRIGSMVADGSGAAGKEEL